MTKLRRTIPAFLIAAVSIGAAANASGFAGSVPEIRMQPIPETMQTSDADYPPKSKRFGEEGAVYLAITVSAYGRVTACSVYRSSGFRLLDERSCAIAIERFRFLPARRDGIAVEDQAILPMDWRLQE